MKKTALISLSLFLYACGSQKKAIPRLPNIVLIMADDMGYGDAGCYNNESLIITPNIDKLASEGILFTDAHSPSSVCTPTRYGLLTGRYSWRTRLKSGVIIGYDEQPLIEKGRNTLGSLLQKSGYSTACIGKWHLGLNWETINGYVIRDDENRWQEYEGIFRENEENIDFTKPVSGGPRDLGFNYSFITAGCSTSDPPYVFIENSTPVAIPNVMPPAEYIGLPGFAPGLMDPNWSQELVDTLFTNKGILFIENHIKANPNEPFFLYLALSSPHIPFLVPDFAKGMSKEGPRGDLVYVADWCVGRINETLEKHKLADNTLFIFTSDNGPRKGANGHLSAEKFKGYKGTIWEGGNRVPFIARWPGKIDAGIRSDALISLTDMFATFAGITGTRNFEGGEDSNDILPRLKGDIVNKDDSNPRVFHSSNGVFSLRKGKWKYIEGKEAGDNSLMVNKPELKNYQGLLYDLSEDPYETVDVSGKNPSTVKKMQDLLNDIRSE